MKHIIARHGTGSILVTDRGTSFTSVFFRETCKILGIKQLYTSALHPQSNGQIESWHKTLNQGLSRYVNASGTNWDTLVPLYLMAYRATPHGTTGYSPYFLLHGREMVLPTTQDIRAKLSPKVKGTDYEGKLETLKSSLNIAYKIVRRNIRKSKETNRQYYDRKAKKRSLKVNNWVYLFNPARKRGECSKFKFFLPTTQIVRAKLSSKVKGTDYERKARKLKVKPELSLQDGSPEHSKIQ